MGFTNSGDHIKTGGIPRWLVAIVDISLVTLGLYVAVILVTGDLQGFQLEPLVLLLPLLSLVTVLLFNNLGLYSRQLSGMMPVIRSLITGVIGLALFSVIFAFWTRAFIFHQGVFLAAPAIQLPLLIGWRLLYWRLEFWIHGQKKLLVIGGTEEVEQALEKIMCLPKGLFEVLKVIDPDQVDQFSEWLARVDAVMVAGSLELETKNKVIRECFDRNREIFIVPDLYEIILTRAMITQIYDTPVVECRDMQVTFGQLFTKRIFDLVVALVMVVPAVPVLLILSILIKATSPGPVIFAQERVGFRNRIFTLYKLRTMVDDAEEQSGPVFSTEADDRITPVGRFMRATRLDELPQLYNVLRGDLSIVGPRPERPYFVEIFQKVMPEYKLRHLVKPGITGLAQVAGHYATNTRDKLRYDLYYVSDHSLLMDFRILMLTVPTLINREAARGLSKEAEGRLTWPKS